MAYGEITHRKPISYDYNLSFKGHMESRMHYNHPSVTLESCSISCVYILVFIGHMESKKYYNQPSVCRLHPARSDVNKGEEEFGPEKVQFVGRASI